MMERRERKEQLKYYVLPDVDGKRLFIPDYFVELLEACYGEDGIEKPKNFITVDEKGEIMELTSVGIPVSVKARLVPEQASELLWDIMLSRLDFDLALGSVMESDTKAYKLIMETRKKLNEKLKQLGILKKGNLIIDPELPICVSEKRAGEQR